MKKTLSLLTTVTFAILLMSNCATGRASDSGSQLSSSGNSKYSTSSSTASTSTTKESTEDRINREIRELDAAYKAGTLKKAEYGAKKAALMQQLFN